MKKIVWLTFFISGSIFAQKIDYNKIILPRNSESISIEERLVQLAWQNNPESEIARKNIGISEYQVNRAKWDWLNRVIISGNVNEFTIDQDNDRAQFFPRYNFAVNVPLGILIKQPIETKIARQQLYVEQEKLNVNKLQIRAEVLKRYETYKRDLQIANLIGEILSETKTLYDKVNQEIIDGLRPVDDSYDVSERLKNANIDKINADSKVNIAKLSVEEMIGIKLEEVIN